MTIVPPILRSVTSNAAHAARKLSLNDLVDVIQKAKSINIKDAIIIAYLRGAKHFFAELTK